MPQLPDLELGVLTAAEIRLAGAVAARAMADNPTSIALFGEDRTRRIRSLEPVFTLVLTSVPAPIVCARRNGYVVGLAAMAPPAKCLFRQSIDQARTLEIAGKRIRLGSAPRIPRTLLLPLLRIGPGGMARVSTMTETHLKHDPAELHHHVELVAVEPALQGLGVGRLMMEELCRGMDRDGAPGWLETDTEADVRFYRHYGFEVAAESTVLGARNWYMRRT